VFIFFSSEFILNVNWHYVGTWHVPSVRNKWWLIRCRHHFIALTLCLPHCQRLLSTVNKLADTHHNQLKIECQATGSDNKAKRWTFLEEFALITDVLEIINHTRHCRCHFSLFNVVLYRICPVINSPLGPLRREIRSTCNRSMDNDNSNCGSI